MADYDYLNGKKRIEEILDSPNETARSDSLPVSSAFSYENGYYGYVTALFVDICESTKLFSDSSIRKTSKAKIIRSFTSEIIEILRKDDNLRDIGIRGDCVFAIYTSPSFADDYEIFEKAVYINTFSKMLNSLLEKRNYRTISYGIGIATGNDLVVKAGRAGTGINDLVWIGESVPLASKFSNLANRHGASPIIVSNSFFDNFSKAIEKSNPSNTKLEWFFDFNKDGWSGKQCDIVKTDMNKWVSEGMKNG